MIRNDNAFSIRTDVGRVKVCWQVTGVRKDAWAQANRMEVEEKKPETERGKYLHPELFGKKAVGVHQAPTSRFAEVLPEELHERADRVVSDLDSTDAADHKDLRTRLDEARRWLDERAAANRALRVQDLTLHQVGIRLQHVVVPHDDAVMRE